MTERPLSRQPSCGTCRHEEHIFYDCEWCLCSRHNPPGIYEEQR